MNRYSGAKKGRSHSRADNIALPSPSSKDAMFTTGAAATSRDHFVNQSARLCVIPSIRVLCRSSNPTHETTAPPAVLLHDRGTCAAAQQRTYRNCCRYDAHVPHRHFTDCQDGAANGAGPLECTAGVTPASTRSWDRTTEARTGPGPLYTRNGKRPPTIQRTCNDTASWPVVVDFGQFRLRPIFFFEFGQFDFGQFRLRPISISANFDFGQFRLRPISTSANFVWPL